MVGFTGYHGQQPEDKLNKQFNGAVSNPNGQSPDDLRELADKLRERAETAQALGDIAIEVGIAIGTGGVVAGAAKSALKAVVERELKKAYGESVIKDIIKGTFNPKYGGPPLTNKVVSSIAAATGLSVLGVERLLGAMFSPAKTLFGVGVSDEVKADYVDSLGDALDGHLTSKELDRLVDAADAVERETGMNPLASEQVVDEARALLHDVEVSERSLGKTGSNALRDLARDVALGEIESPEQERQRLGAKLHGNLNDGKPDAPGNSKPAHEPGVGDGVDGGYCFTAETLITLANGGYRPISEIAVGDKVLCFDRDGNLHTGTVTHTFRHENVDVFDGDGWGVTANHPFLTGKGDFRAFGEIDESEQLVAYDSRPIRKPRVVKRATQATTYNLTVEPHHTYIAAGYRVHNKVPVVLDLDNDGVELTELSSSNTFYDLGGDGYKHRTAWAGVGDGVLAIDADGDGKITERKEIVFKDWDPTAKDDMEALRSVFDSNDDGKLDTSDAEFSKFRVVVTNSDGTTSVKTLGELGITSINLITDATKIALKDGSSIDGLTTYTKSDGSTGKAAAVTFAAESQGYAIQNSTVTNGDGSVTITNVGRAADGGIANVTVTNTSADGNTRSISFDYNGDGVVDQAQTVVKVLNGDGSRTETITNRNGGNVLLDRTQTTTSADGTSVSISRDTRGGGYFNETETRVTTAGSLAITLAKLNPNGSLISSKTTTTTSDGLTRTEAHDLDGNGSTDLAISDATVVHGDASRTQTVSQASGNGTLLNRVVTDTDATGQNRIVTTDADGDGDTDRTSTVTVVDTAGTTVTTATVTNGNGSLRDKSVTSISADSLTYVTQIDRDGDGIIDLTRTDVTVINGDGSRTQTITETNADASQRDKTIIVKGADGRGRNIQTDVDGNGINDQTETIVIAGDGSSVDTVTNLNANGSFWSKSVTSSSADGLTTTTQLDADGNGGYETVASSVTVKNGDGSATVSETITNGNASLRGKVVTSTSADGLSVTVQKDRDGNGAFDLTSSDVTVLNGDGSFVRTVSNTAGNGALLGKNVTTTSVDRNTIYAARDLNGDGALDQSELITRQANGNTVDMTTNYRPDGQMINRSTVTTSANGLSTITQIDLNADDVADRTTNQVTIINADGSRVTTATSTAANGGLLSKATSTVSGNGLSSAVASDVNGDAITDLTTTDVTVLNADGSRTRTLSDLNTNDSLRDRVTTVTSDDGLSINSQFDLDGNATVDLTSTDATVLNADGSTTRTVSNTNANGLRDQSVTTTSADGRTVTSSLLANGSVNTKQRYERGVNLEGESVESLSNLNASDVMLNRTINNTSANGLVVTSRTDQNGDGTFDYSASSVTALNVDGSRTQTVTTTNAAGLVNQEVTTVSGNGLSSTVQTDRDGDGTFDRTTLSTRVLNADGSVVDTVTVTNAKGGHISQVVTTTSGDRKTVTVATSLLGVNVQNETRVLQANGDTVSTVISKNTAGTVLSTVTTTTSANGLSKVVQTKNGAGTVIDTQTTTIALNADGSQTETLTQTQTGGVSSTTATTTSGNGLTKSQTATLTGAATTTANTTDVTVLNADGSRTQTVQVKNGSNVLKDKAVTTTSANGLSVSTTLDVNGDGTMDDTFSSITSTDGSKVDTAIYNKLAGGLRRKDVTTTSTDGRTITLQRDTDGNAVTDLTVTTVKNADGSVTETRVGAALGGVQAFSQVSRIETDLDGGRKTVTEYFNGSGTLISRTSEKTAANGLSQSAAFDINADGNIDKQSSTTVTLNADGSTTETERFVYTGGVPSSTRITIKSADGSVTTTKLDLDGNGITEQASTTTLATDGSIVHQFTVYDNATGAQTSQQSVTIGVNDRAVAKSTYETIIAKLQIAGPSYGWKIVAGIATYQGASFSGKNDKPRPEPKLEWVYTVQTNTVKDTSTIFVGANGSNQWVRTVSGTQVANATHYVDANNVETWSWNIVNATLWGQTSSLPIVTASGSIQIDVATRDLYIGRAENIFSAALSREMAADERETLAQYITGGVLNENLLATKILASAEFTTQYGTMNNVEFVTRLYTNAMGHLPSAALRDYCVAQLVAGTSRATLLTTLGSGIESGQVTRSEFQNGTINETVSYSIAPAGVTVDLANTANNTGAALGDDYTLVKNVVGSAFNDTLKGDGKANMLGGGAGNDILDGGAGSDILIGGAGNDTLTGGADSDTVRYDSEGARVTVNLAAGTAMGSTAGTDTLSGIENAQGSSYTDMLIGDANSNVLTGGAGEDILKGGAGNDTYRLNIGDGQDEVYDVDITWSQQTKNVSTGSKTLNNSYSYSTWVFYPSGQDGGGTWKNETKTVNVSMSVGTYNIEIAPVETHANAGTNDVLQFGAGIAPSDLAFEFRGSDLYVGLKDPDRPTAKASELDDAIRLVNWLDPLDRVETVKFSDGSTMSIQSLVGTVPSAPVLNAVNGTAGIDVLNGTVGGDKITGGDGNDTVAGAKGDDRLEGGKGDDTYVFARGDTWDVILDENKYLETTTATQSYTNQHQKTYTYTYYTQVKSGDAKDGYYYDYVQKSGSKIVTFTDSGSRLVTTSTWKVEDGGVDALSFAAGITVDDVAVKLVGNDLLIVLRDPGNPAASFWELTDRMRIENWTDVKNRVEKFQFADGTIIDVSAMVAAETGGEGADTITGDAATNWIAGGGGNDTLSGLGGNDVLIGGAGDDVIAGGNGADRIHGGAGKDTADYAASGSAVAINLGAGTVSGGDAAGDVLNGVENVIGTAANDSLTGDANENVLTGGDGLDILDGGGGNDTLTGGLGADTLTGGSGTDLYATARGGGADQIAASLDDGSADQLVFKGDVDSDQLWFSQSGSDLVISVIGTTDSMTVKGWYTAGNDRLDRIAVGDGDYVMGSDVEALVTAMAGLSPPAFGQTKLSSPQQQTLASTLAAAWHPS